MFTKTVSAQPFLFIYQDYILTINSLQQCFIGALCSCSFHLYTVKSMWCSFHFTHICICLLQLALPDWSFIMRIAFALASSSAVTHLWRSTSVLAFKWYVRPPLLRTILQASSVSICAVAKLIVPRHVWAISACVLQEENPGRKRDRQTFINTANY